ncbi:TetR/AcrR family transcriptional regulator [Actinomycetospora chiangmaiensis]|uniref:TetR/AcrR family transcriptional regulator n=1 Tax=Actinomycetospora chiangmaiensis TaxID=402650 RepID=UPI00036E1301|nr:TetR/AcrR family transcriptional regulator [Actinomycetospora chiangmaiensis]
MTSGTRRRLAPEVRRRQVLDAAVAVFSEEGLHGASMDAIAARAGVSKPLVYAHGGTKDELFAACLAREADRLVATLTAAALPDDRSRGPGAEDRLRRAFRAFFGAVTTHRQGWTVLYRQASTGEFAGTVDAARRAIVRRAAELLAAELGGSAEAAEPVAHTLVGAAEGLTDWWLGGDHPTHGQEPADLLADMLMAVVWPGLDALRHP